MMEQKYYIVAANYNDFMVWLNSGRPRELIPELDKDLPCRIIYVTGEYVLNGLSDIKGFYLKGCEKHPEYQQIKQIIDIIKFKSKSVSNTGANGYTISGVILDDITEDFSDLIEDHKKRNRI